MALCPFLPSPFFSYPPVANIESVVYTLSLPLFLLFPYSSEPTGTSQCGRTTRKTILSRSATSDAGLSQMYTR